VKEARKFTKDDPCTKIELHNCFVNPATGHYTSRPLVTAKTEIGDNAPKYLAKKGYLEIDSSSTGVDYYRLTPDGEDWLREGLQRYLVLHPERVADVIAIPRAAVSSPRVMRRSAHPQITAPTVAAKPVQGIIRRRSMRP
jgi:hypothetical protein